ncbi:phenol 2-monooxygenase [Chaetomidium leptoderma]|uniref:Phenol 2-monooxygenase n=1 Tax=Chaetomidium leptoderma TaxID=669021 RepID=A0AAN6ZV48_9PEZI|nr:phenol 2-monooxygenase [Chaetomidium leptoderma]
MADEEVVKTDLLIVGAGPAGASLACFLAAHVMAGEEFARVYSWGHDPKHKVRNRGCLCYTPNPQSTNPQSTPNIIPCPRTNTHAGRLRSSQSMQPRRPPANTSRAHLDQEAVHKGWSLRFNTRFVRLTRPSPEVVISEVFDDITKRTYKIQSRYLFGCDGARSQVVRELGIPLIKKPGQGLALNVLVRAVMSHIMENRIGNLHWVFRPEEMDPPPWGWAAVARMVRPWNEWMFIFLPAPGADVTADAMNASDDEYLARVSEFIGDDSVKVELLHVSKWWVNEIVAEYYSDGNVFCFGDATHRHPPFNGLGSNTCIQDAFNLAWKIDYVMSGKAGPALLDSFNAERQPVGAAIIARANQGLRDHMHWQQTLGMLEPDKATRLSILAELDDATSAVGRARRQAFQAAIEATTTEYHGLGIEMNQRYVSRAVYHDHSHNKEEGLLLLPPPTEPEDPVKTHVVTTYPGCRVPHVWVNTRVPGKRVSTIDLVGKGRFCLLTGPGGAGWKEAARIAAYSIGWKQDYEDVYFDWARKREVEEDGCVLVRPDRFVAWRCKGMVEDPVGRLEEVMRSVLAL